MYSGASTRTRGAPLWCQWRLLQICHQRMGVPRRCHSPGLLHPDQKSESIVFDSSGSSGIARRLWHQDISGLSTGTSRIFPELPHFINASLGTWFVIAQAGTTFSCFTSAYHRQSRALKWGWECITSHTCVTQSKVEMFGDYLLLAFYVNKELMVQFFGIARIKFVLPVFTPQFFQALASFKNATQRTWAVNYFLQIVKSPCVRIDRLLFGITRCICLCGVFLKLCFVFLLAKMYYFFLCSSCNHIFVTLSCKTLHFQPPPLFLPKIRLTVSNNK